MLVSGGMSGRCSLQNSTSVVGEIGGEGVREGEGEGEGGGGGEDETQECGGGGCAKAKVRAQLAAKLRVHSCGRSVG